MASPHPRQTRSRSSSLGDRPPAWARPVLLLFVLATVVLAFPGARERFQSPYSGIQTRNLVVQDVRADSPNVGSDLRAGDELYAIEGVRLRNAVHYQHVVASNRAYRPAVVPRSAAMESCSRFASNTNPSRACSPPSAWY